MKLKCKYLKKKKLKNKSHHLNFRNMLTAVLGVSQTIVNEAYKYEIMKIMSKAFPKILYRAKV